MVIFAAAIIGSFAIQAIPQGGGNTGSDVQVGTGEEVGKQITELPPTHIPEGDTYTGYNSVPPTSGPHWESNWASCGIHDKENEVPDSRIVHNLEHGQIVISYNLTDESEIDRLKNIARDLPRDRHWLIVRPYSQIAPGEVAITAWGWLDKFSGVDEDRIRNFYVAHFNQRRESISCLRTP